MHIEKYDIKFFIYKLNVRFRLQKKTEWIEGRQGWQCLASVNLKLSEIVFNREYISFLIRYLKQTKIENETNRHLK